MKKFLASIFALFTIISLSSCEKNSETETQAKAQNTQKEAQTKTQIVQQKTQTKTKIVQQKTQAVIKNTQNNIQTNSPAKIQETQNTGTWTYAS